MIWIDDREGSNYLAEPLRRMGLETELVRLEFGDLAFVGRGEGDAHCDIGIEFKRLPDLHSSLRTRRLTKRQLPGLRQTYDFSWLLIEGEWRVDSVGRVLVPGRHRRKRVWRPLPGALTASSMEKTLLSLEIRGGLHVRLTRDRDASLRFIHDVYRWFTDKSLDAHASHLAAGSAPPISPISGFRNAVMAWPGVGLKLSRSLEDRFGASLKRAAHGSVADYAAITTIDKSGTSRRVGTKAAQRLIEFLEGR